MQQQMSLQPNCFWNVNLKQSWIFFDRMPMKFPSKIGNDTKTISIATQQRAFSKQAIKCWYEIFVNEELPSNGRLAHSYRELDLRSGQSKSKSRCGGVTQIKSNCDIGSTPHNLMPRTETQMMKLNLWPYLTIEVKQCQRPTTKLRQNQNLINQPNVPNIIHPKLRILLPFWDALIAYENQYADSSRRFKGGRCDGARDRNSPLATSRDP